MTSEQLRTVTLGFVLAILIVPFGGPYTLPALLFVAAVAGFDLWRQAQRREAIAAGAPVRAERPMRSGRDILVRVVALVAAFVALAVVYTALRSG